jgi:hypothetical protein
MYLAGGLAGTVPLFIILISRAARVRPTPDLRLADLVSHFDSESSTEEDRARIVDRIFRQVRRCAREEKITVWGRKNYPLGYDHMYYFPLSRIQPAFWEHDGLYPYYFLKGGLQQAGETTRSPYSDLNGYADIWFNLKEIERAVRRGDLQLN